MSYTVLKSDDVLGGRVDQELEGSYAIHAFYGHNAFYNITANNNKVYVNDNSVSYIVTLDSGNYSSEDLREHLQTKLNAMGGSNSYTVTYSSITAKYTFTGDTNNFYFEFGTNTSNDARKLLGFNATDGTGALTQVSNNVIQLSIHPIIYARIKQDICYKVMSKNHFYASFMIFDKSSFGESLRMVDVNHPVIVQLKRTKAIDITFFDEDHNELDFNGTEWSLVLKSV